MRNGEVTVRIQELMGEVQAAMFGRTPLFFAWFWGWGCF